MAELFVFGTLWFWLLAVASVVLLCIFVENENGIGSTVVFLVTLGLLQFASNVKPLAYVWNHPYQIVGLIAAYFVLGTIWGTIKWWIYVRDQLEHYEDLKSEWLRAKGFSKAKVVPDELKSEWAEYLKGSAKHPKTGYYNNRQWLDKPPLARENKGRIMLWMSLWLPSMISSLFSDFVKRIFKAIYYRIASQLQNISDRAFKGISDDLPPEKPAPANEL